LFAPHILPGMLVALALPAGLGACSEVRHLFRHRPLASSIGHFHVPIERKAVDTDVNLDYQYRQPIISHIGGASWRSKIARHAEAREKPDHANIAMAPADIR
jgi:hypothetical protein